MIRSKANYEFSEWLSDRRNSRQMHHRMGEVGYVVVRNPSRTDGKWRWRGERVVIYAKANLSIRDRHIAGQRLVKTPPPAEYGATADADNRFNGGEADSLFNGGEA
jgi:hypothetical protein